MTGAVFLSAGVPDPRRGENYAKTADTVAITAATSALVYVTLGRRLLVWGGQPAITPMIWTVAEEFDVDYASWVRLYQSLYFKDEFPEDNERFHNVTFTPEVAHEEAASLRLMRERMFAENTFEAGVFIGGMRGIVDEFELFREMQPEAMVLAVASTGGAALELVERLGTVDPELVDDFDFVGLFHRKIGISVRERRYNTPGDQPKLIEERFGLPNR